MSALTKLIDFLGLTAQTEELVNAMDAKDADNLQAAKSYADTVAAAAGSSAAASSIPISQKGTPGGVAELNSQGTVPSHQLPSFVDDVIEGYRLGVHFYSDAAHTTIVTDETGKSSDQLSGKIYVDLGDNRTYRWAGSDYAVISESLALGITEATAGRGDWTYTAYQHALAKGNQFASNLYKITTNAEGHVVAATPVTKQDIVDLGIPGSDTVYEDATTTTHGLMSASDKAKLDGVEAGAQVNPGDATTTAHGLMSAADKAKLDGIEANANNYSLPTMSPTTKGGAKLGHGLSVEDDALNLGPLTDSGSGASVQTDGCGIFGVTGEGFAHQDGTPTPDNPQEIRVARGRNLCNESTLQQGAINDGVDVSSTTRVRTSSFIPVEIGKSYILTSGGSSVEWSYHAYSSASQSAYVGEGSWAAAGSAQTVAANAKYIRLILRKANSPTVTPSDFPITQLEQGTTPTPYVPYGHIGLDITTNGQTTTTPIPLPAKGFAGALPDGTKDTLEIDSAGRVEWMNACEMYTVLGTEPTMDAADLGTYYRASIIVLNDKKSVSDANVGLCSHAPFNYGWSYDRLHAFTTRDTVYMFAAVSSAAEVLAAYTGAEYLYPLLTPTTESLGYIALPELPAGATVSIPELEAIGVEWWVEGIPEVTEYGQAMQARLQGEIDEVEQAIADLVSEVASGTYEKARNVRSSHTLLKAGTESSYTQLVLYDNYVVLERVVNGSVVKTIPLWQ